MDIVPGAVSRGETGRFVPRLFDGRANQGQVKRTGQIIADATMHAQLSNGNELTGSRSRLAQNMCDYYSGSIVDGRTVDMLMRQSFARYIEAVGATILAGSREVAEHERNISRAQTIAQVGRSVVGMEASARVRAIDGAFAGAFHAQGRQLPGLTRFWRSTKFRVGNPTMPSDVLIAGPTRLSALDRQFEYGRSVGQIFALKFAELYNGNSEATKPITTEEITTTALTQIMKAHLPPEREAVRTAFNHLSDPVAS